MGQLERYGLYVLCLVIFLILGVAIWGGDPPPPPRVADDLTTQLNRASAPPVADPIVAQLPPNPSISELLELSPMPAAEMKEPASTRLAPPAASQPDSPASSTSIAPAGTAAEPSAERAAPASAGQADYYVVMKGDILEEIARVHLGRRDRWREILALNPGVDPKKLQEGQRLRMPPPGSGADAGTRDWMFYLVRPGDMLEGIARAHLGRRDRWREILALNPGLDPKKLRPGSEIRVPIRK